MVGKSGGTRAHPTASYRVARVGLRVRRPRGGAAGILLRSELARRTRVYLLLVGVFAFSTASLVVLLGAANGMLGSVGIELEDTLSAHWRVADGDAKELAGGRFFLAAGAAAERIERATPGAVAVPRIEIEGVFLQTSRFEDFDSGLIVGVDPALDREVAAFEPRITEGRFLDGENVWIEGKPYPQLVLGRDMLEALGMEVFNGTLNPKHVLNVTAGRFSTESGSPRPVVREGVVVGTFELGFSPVDRRTLVLHVAVARELLRMQLDDEPANVILVRAPPEADVAGAARAEGFNVTSSRDFRDDYLEAVLGPMRIFTVVIVVLVLGLAGGWVANVAASAILSDRRRIAVLRALGLPPRLVVGPVSLAILAAGLVGALAGLALGALAGELVELVDVAPAGSPRLSLRVDLPASVALGIGLAVLATAALAALATSLALRRIPVTDALRE